MVVATYTKMTVSQDFELRKALRGAGAKYQVVKNTLAERAAKGTKVEGALKDLAGVTSIAYTTGDPVAMAKVLTKIREGHAGIHLQGRRSRRPRGLDQGNRSRWRPCRRRKNCSRSCCS